MSTVIKYGFHFDPPKVVHFLFTPILLRIGIVQSENNLRFIRFIQTKINKPGKTWLQKIEIIFVRARAQLTQKQTNIEHIIIRLFYTIHKVKRNINIYSKDVIEKKL
jgi:hypothetical protein